MAQIRMKQDHNMRDSTGADVILKRGQVVNHLTSTLSEAQVEALVLSELASDSLTDYHILYRGEFVANTNYYSGEVITHGGTLWEFTDDHNGAWDLLKVTPRVGIDYV